MRYLLDMGINEVGNLAAPPGSQAWAIAVRFEIQSLLERNKNIVKSLQAYLLEMEHYTGYNQLTDENGEPFSCFVDFCSAKSPWGLGYSLEKIQEILGEELWINIPCNPQKAGELLVELLEIEELKEIHKLIGEYLG